jgi:hypothetical protein
LPELNGPRRDGLVLWRALTDPEIGMFSDDNVDVLHEGTSSDILASAAALFESAKPGDIVLLYFSGHAKRISKDDLILCARNTLSHSASSLLSTGVPCVSLSKMIERSHADSVIVILDCCFSGSFKGVGRDVVDELKGTGRFVLSASQPIELASDASHRGQPSPFTQAIVSGLMSETAEYSAGEGVDLDALYSFVDKFLPKDGPRPSRGFDGSGNIVLSRAHSRQRGDTSIANGRHDNAGLRQPESVHAFPEKDRPEHYGLPWRFNRRLSGDLSIADLRIWMLTSALALAVIFCLYIAYHSWPQVQTGDGTQYKQDPHRDIVWPYIALSALIVICSVIEGLVVTGRSRKAESRREILQATETRPAVISRKVREILSYVAATAVFTVLFGFENYQATWIVGLSLLGALALISAISSMRQGDAAYLSGALLYVAAIFLPIANFYNNTQIGISDAAGITEIVLGGLMIATWWLKASRGILVVISALCLLPIVSDFAASKALVGPYVGLVGLGLAILTWVLGAGQLLGEVGEQS